MLTWRSMRYLLGTLPVALLAAVPIGLLTLPFSLAAARLTRGAPLPAVLLVLLGAALLGWGGPLVAAPLATVERRRLWSFEGDGVRAVTERRRRGELLYCGVMVTVIPAAYALVGLLIGTLVTMAAGPVLVWFGGPTAVGVGTVHTVSGAIPGALAGLLLLPAMPLLLSVLARGHAALARRLLVDGPEFQAVARSRTRLIDAFDAERRRIERDLHDGAQQRLVGLTLQLGMARWDMPDDAPGAGAVARAHEQAQQLMADLRELIHGIHPHVLTDLGLPAALRDVADRCPVPVEVVAELPGRLPDRVEVTAYFVVSEALTNVARHSGAHGVRITATRTRAELVVEVIDDGRGGADPAAGSGLTGLADRVAATGGRMLLSSPPGGPTRVRAVLPCR